MKSPLYPFSAIVDQYPLKTVLLLNAVDPGLGGVLIRGKKGHSQIDCCPCLGCAVARDIGCLRFFKDGEQCTICGGTIKKIKVNNRGTYFCSKHQKGK
jgi:magnesium chelatase subunit D